MCVCDREYEKWKYYGLCKCFCKCQSNARDNETTFTTIHALNDKTRKDNKSTTNFETTATNHDGELKSTITMTKLKSIIDVQTEKFTSELSHDDTVVVDPY